MTSEEYEKANRFHQFLKNLTKGTHGYLTIEWEDLISMTSGFMKCEPFEAYRILMKMKEYGMIKEMDRHFIIVNTD
jgi:hypothetical protein